MKRTIAERNPTTLTQQDIKAICAGRTPQQIGEAIQRLLLAGRNRKELDLQKVAVMRMAGCLIPEIAAELGVDEKTIDRKLKNDQLFHDVFYRGNERGKAAIRMGQYRKAVIDKDITALIWAGKQRLGQKDQVENSGADRLAEVMAVLKHARDNQGDESDDIGNGEGSGGGNATV